MYLFKIDLFIIFLWFLNLGLILYQMEIWKKIFNIFLGVCVGGGCCWYDTTKACKKHLSIWFKILQDYLPLFLSEIL